MEPKHFKHWPKHLPRHLTVPATTLYFNLEVSGQRYPDKPAVVFYDSKLSYRELQRQVDLMAGFLQNRCGVRKGDRVILQMQNSPQFIVAYYAILRADAAVLPVSPMHVTDELVHYFEDAGTSTILIAQDLYPQVKPLLGKQAKHVIVATYSDYLTEQTTLDVPEFVRAPRQAISDPGAVSWSDALAADYKPLAAAAQADDLAAILYTSGTTGTSKGCMHTHQTIMHTLVGAAVWEGFNADSVALATAPLFHVTGMQHSMNAALYAGATIAILPRWNADAAGYMIERYGCTHWANVPTMVVDLLAHPATAGRDLSSLMNIFGGGASMPEPVAQKLFELCGIDYMEAYGMTETISQTHMNPAHKARKQCLGFPTFDTESLVINPETLSVLGPNEQGEIVVHGPQIMLGYWQRPDANEAVFIDIGGKKFMRTGDLGRYDEDGYYYIADRLKRMINASGFKVWPAEVEATLYKHPDIREVAVISAPDTRRGETVKAVVVLKDGRKGLVSADDITQWSRLHMAAYKVPRLVDFTDALPRSGTGKIQWRALQEKEWEGTPIALYRAGREAYTLPGHIGRQRIAGRVSLPTGGTIMQIMKHALGISLLVAAGIFATQVMAIDFVEAAPKQTKVLVDNDKVRVIHATFKKGDKVPVHSHPDIVVYILKQGKIKFTNADGKVVESNPRAGEASFRPATTHSHEHLEDSEAIIVELKK